MKSKITGLVIGALFAALSLRSQQPIPADADAFYKKAMSSINQKHITWIRRTALMVNSQNMDEAGIRQFASNYAGQNKFGSMSIEALVTLVMMQSAKDNEEELRNMMAYMKKTNEEKQKLREAQEKMEKNKSAMSKQMLDSFRRLTKPQVNAVSATQTTKLQPSPTVTKISRPVNSQVSATEIKQVQDSLKSKLDGMNEMSEMTSLHLQQSMDRRSKFINTLSNIMKKISETQDSIIQNMK